MHNCTGWPSLHCVGGSEPSKSSLRVSSDTSGPGPEALPFKTNHLACSEIQGADLTVRPLEDEVAVGGGQNLQEAMLALSATIQVAVQLGGL